MKSGSLVFVSLAQVMRAHRTSLELHGGMDGVRDQGAVESALASAMNTWNYSGGDAFDVAAAYAFHLAESQAFLDETSEPRLPRRWLFWRSTDFPGSRTKTNSTMP